MIARHRRDRAYLAFLGHRISGIGLAVFLPLHFIVLAEVLAGEAALDSVLAFTAHPVVKAMEWLLLVLVCTHLIFGLRLLMLELRPWRGRGADRRGWILPGLILALAVGTVAMLGAV
ncbi:MAG: succinate dehydrogenase, cytochrome b556 subunit [Pseudomonadota bacterium]|jgi:fumarate reductase subunit D|nr:succinate dehydrogenase, cytochrome b556 subunit [Pseudomonadota bacterium]